jgi:hypothetical protein
MPGKGAIGTSTIFITLNERVTYISVNNIQTYGLCDHMLLNVIPYEFK